MRKKLILWEKEHGLRGNFIANKIGVSNATWSKIKLGKQRPTFEQLERFKTEFQIDDVFELFRED